jgi:hypothetical protein
MSDKTKVFLCCNVDEMIEDLGERNFTRGLTKWVRLADYESLTDRLAAAEAAAVELWNEATDEYWFADNHAAFRAKYPWIDEAAKGGPYDQA